MGRHALRRGGLTAVVSSLVVAVAAATVTVVAESGDSARADTTAGADTTEITLVDPSSSTPREVKPHGVGRTGFVHQQSGIGGLLWTSHENDGTSGSTGTSGRTVTLKKADGSVYTPVSACSTVARDCRTAWYGTDGTLVALPTALTSESVDLWDPATGKTSTVTSTYDYRALAGDTVVTGRTLIDFPDGQRRERFVTGDSFTLSDNEIVAADADGVLVQHSFDLYSIDVETAVSTVAFTDVYSATHYVQSEDRIGWYDSGTGELHTKPRTDPTAEEQVVTLPYASSLAGPPVLVGDWLLLPRATSTGTPLTAVSITDGTTRTLLTASGEHAVTAPGGDAFVTGGTGVTDWWVQRVSESEDGTPRLTKVHEIPAKENTKTGIALSRGSLRVAEDSPTSTSDTTSVRTLTTDGAATLTASAATDSASVNAECPYAGTTCSALWGNSGRYPSDVYLETFSDVDEGGSGFDQADRLARISGSDLEFGTEGGAIVDVSDGYAVYNSGGTSPLQYVGEFGQGQKLKRSVRAAALGGSTLWSATSTAGKLTSYSLTGNRTLATVTVPGASCVPTELQAAGRWVYWVCGDSASAGVYDTKAGTSVAVEPGDVLLGDGFTVRHDHTADELVLTDAATGTTRVIASGLPDSGSAADRRHRWTVDEYTGLVAWFDMYERTHVATTGVTPSAPAVFVTENADGHVEAGSSDPWNGDWLLSRPVTSWSLTFTSVQSGETGKGTRTVTGGAVTAWLSAVWDGRTASGIRFPNGRFTWTLKATGLGTSTAATVATGSGFLERGMPVRHDFDSPDGPDGTGDVLTLNSSGGLTYQLGTGSGTFSGKTTGTGWATTVKPVAFGDLSGDRCNDVLVRLSSGALRLYKPGCGAAVKPSTSYTTLASSGWTQYNVLTSPGDVSGDGRPDLVTRNSSTGAVYLHKGTSTGKLASRVKLYDNWKGYKKIVGVGDIDGDGVGDLIAQDTANTLYRYSGSGTGTFKARVRLFGDWGASYNVVVGAGDLNRDGRPDLAARDSSGNLYRNYGDGRGSFGSRTKIATGWGGYKSLS